MKEDEVAGHVACLE